MTLSFCCNWARGNRSWLLMSLSEIANWVAEGTVKPLALTNPVPGSAIVVEVDHLYGRAVVALSTYCLVAASRALTGSAGSWIWTRDFLVIRRLPPGTRPLPARC